MSHIIQRPTGIRGIAMRMRGAFNALIGNDVSDWDDSWFGQGPYDSSAGMVVTPETAMRLSTVYACVRYRSELPASLPIVIYRRTDDGGKVRAPEFPLYSVLCKRPNRWQTKMEYFEMEQAHLDLRGNSYSRIVPGPNGAISELWPIHPDLVRVYRIPNGSLQYQVRSRFTAEIKCYTQDEIFHVRDLSYDGLIGLSRIAQQREMIGNGLAMQDSSGRRIANDARPGVILRHPGKFKDDATRKKFGDSFRDNNTGKNRGGVGVVEEGIEVTVLPVSNADSQFLESQKFSREEIAGMFRVPGHKIGIPGNTNRSTAEQVALEFVTDCIRPIVVRWEERINTDLIDPLEIGEPGEFFCEFLLDGLLRGDLKSRYDAYKVGIDEGWLCPNDVARFENLNPIAVEDGGNDYRRPLNYIVVGALEPALPGVPDTPPQNSDPSAPPEDSPSPASLARLNMLASEAAARVVRKEVASLRESLRKSERASSFWSEEFRTTLSCFYGQHADFVRQTMCISREEARAYADANLELIRSSGFPDEMRSAIDWIEDVAAEKLAAVALSSRQSLQEAVKA